MADRSVVTRFEAKADGYLRTVTQMQGATEKFAKSAAASATKHKADWDKISRSAIVGGAVIGSVVVASAKAYADFEQAMSGVAAVADATAQQQHALSEAAIKAGAATVFSASEAAKAEAELAKAGVGVNDILQGGLVGSMNLAAAGQIDLAKSAEISAQAMNIFKLRGQDVGHIADVLTAGANKSAAGVDDLGMALQQGGLLAKQTGLSLEDTVGVLSAFADNALKGSDAGTSLKTMLQRLTPQSKEQADAMAKLGLSFYDANGQFVGITEAADRMRKAFAGLTPEQRNAAMATIFGSDAVRGANILMEQGADGIRRYIAAVNDQGAAQRMAAKQTDNLKGDIEQLKGAFESAFIRGGQGGNAGLRSIVQDVTDLVNKFNDLSPATQANVVKFAALASGALLVGGGLVKVITTATSLYTSVTNVTKAFNDSAFASTSYGQRLSSVASTATKASIALAAIAAAGQVAQSFQQQAAGANEATKSLNAYIARGKDSKAVTDIMRDGFGSLDQQVSILSVDGFGKFGQALDNAASGFGLFGKSLTDTSKDFFKEVDSGLAGLVSSGKTEQASKVFDQIAQSAERQGVSLAQVKDALPQYQAALDGVQVSAQSAAASTSELPPVAEASAKTAQDAADATKAWADELDGINSPALDARAAARAFEEAVDGVTSSIKDNGKTLDIHTEKGRKNQAALDAVAKAAIDQIGAMQANGASQGQLQSKLNTTRDRLIKAAEQFGMSRSAAKQYADQVLGIPASKTTTIKVNGVDGATRAVETLRLKIAGLNGKTVTITQRVVNTTAGHAGASTQGGTTRGEATGGYITGPGTATSDSIPAWLSNGEFVVKAAAVSKYGPNLLHAINDMRYANGGLVGAAKFADGGEVDFSAILGLLRDVTTADDLNSARGTASSKARAVTAAVNALRSLQAQQRAVARSVRGATGNERANLLDRQRLLLGKVAAAEGKLAAARAASTAAAKNAIAVEKEYAADHRPIIDRAITATGRTNSSSKAFLDNIDKLTRMGFRTLALDLLDMGADEAAGIASQAVQSAAKARALQSQFATSASLSAREAALKAALTGQLSSASASSTPVGVAGSAAAAPMAVYVQNPFTGDYLLATVDARADGRVATAAASARRKVG